jgi:uncharacterized RDD family membrane protein YckC
MAKLLVQESNGAREFELVDLEVSLGRELDNSLRLADPSISRHHAVIRQTESGHEIQDLGSSNGVLINGNRVQTALLQDGDRLTLGQLQLTYVDTRPVPVKDSPLGTMRMNMEDMAKLQAGSTTEMPAPPPPPPAPAIIPVPTPMAPPAPKAPAPWPPRPAQQAPNPAPEFLRPYLPPVPDDAQPIVFGGIVERGEFGPRFLAWLIDSLIGAGLVVVFMLVVGALAFVTKGLGCLALLLYPVITIGYLVFMLWCMVQFRATIGKKIMKLRIVPEDNPNGNIDWGMALLRFLGHMVSGFLFDLPYLLILGAERKGFQDMFSRSIVIKVDR